MDTLLSKESVALSESDIRTWCKHNKLPCHFVDLDNLDDNKEGEVFIFTGNTKNKINDGADHHWLFGLGPKVFDSYGAEDYKLPSTYSFFHHKPKQLQPYNTNVCGEFCCLFYYHASKNEPNLDGDELSQSFINRYHLGSDTQYNAEKVLKEFTDKAPKTEARKIIGTKPTEAITIPTPDSNETKENQHHSESKTSEDETSQPEGKGEENYANGISSSTSFEGDQTPTELGGIY